LQHVLGCGFLFELAIVARLLRGEPLELVARETNVSIARLTERREGGLADAATALKVRERDDRDDEIAGLKSNVGETTMDNELRASVDHSLKETPATGDARERPARAASRWMHRDRATRWVTHTITIQEGRANVFRRARRQPCAGCGHDARLARRAPYEFGAEHHQCDCKV
jgi:hypothetical protein